MPTAYVTDMGDLYWDFPGLPFIQRGGRALIYPNADEDKHKVRLLGSLLTIRDGALYCWGFDINPSGRLKGSINVESDTEAREESKYQVSMCSLKFLKFDLILMQISLFVLAQIHSTVSLMRSLLSSSCRQKEVMVVESVQFGQEAAAGSRIPSFLQSIVQNSSEEA